MTVTILGAYSLDEKKHSQTRGKSANPKPSRPFKEDHEDGTRQTDTTVRQTDSQDNSTQSSRVGKITDALDIHYEQPEGKNIVEKSKQNSSLQDKKGEETCEKDEQGVTGTSKKSGKDDIDKPYESALYTDDKTCDDNEQSRCAIGMDDFTDHTGSPVQTEAQHELSREEENEKDEDQDKLSGEQSPRRRRSGLLNEVFALSHRDTFSRTSSESDAVPYGIVEKLHSRQTLSDSSINTCQPPTSQTKSSQSDETFHQHADDIKEEEETEYEGRPKLVRARSQSTSCIEGTPEYNVGREERSSSDSTTNESQEVKTSQSTDALDLQFSIGNHDNPYLP